MSRSWNDASDTVGKIAGALIPNYHPELATARIMFMFVDKASKKGGRPVPGIAKKITGFMEYLSESDFLIEVPLDIWNDLTESTRTALVDHLLEYCTGIEGDDGSMKWSMREPDVKEFSTILDRYGAWNEQLAGFVSVAKKVQLDLDDEEGEIDEVETLNDTES